MTVTVDATRHPYYRMCMLIACALLGACRGARAGPEPHYVELDALDRAAIDVLAREACPRVLTRTFAIDDLSWNAVTGKLWVRRCAARASARGLDVDVDVVGWQWVGQGSWGFDVREYVYFNASVRARLQASVGTDGDVPKVRVWADGDPDVVVREIGRVSARAEGPASSLLGVTSGIFGQGPNVLATAAFRGRVRDLIRERATQGLVIALDDTPAPGTAGHPSTQLLHETEALFPGGALISASYPPNVATTVRFGVAGSNSVLARPVCVSDAEALVDAVVAGRPHPAAKDPVGVLTLRGRGDMTIPAQPCMWALVTGANDDAPTVVNLVLETAHDERRPAARRWVRATLLAYEVDGGAATLFGFTTGTESAPRTLGRPLTSSRSASVWLVAEPVELEDGQPLVVAVSAWKPRFRSLLSTTDEYDEALLGRASFVPAAEGPDVEERRAPLEKAGRRVGWVDVALETVDVR